MKYSLSILSVVFAVLAFLISCGYKDSNELALQLEEKAKSYNNKEDCEMHGFYWLYSKCNVFPKCVMHGKTPCEDLWTGYMWSSLPHKNMKWKDAMAYCKNLKEGNYADWVLPSIDDLKTFCYFDNVVGEIGYSTLGDTGEFWSSNDDGYSAFSVDLSSCYIYVDGNKIQKYAYDYETDYSTKLSVRCVRW